jgi:hypothetical protein
MNAQFIQEFVHRREKLYLSSRSQKGFVSGVSRCMESAVITRELIAHARVHSIDIRMVQVDFANAFGGVAHGLIEYNVARMSLAAGPIRCVVNVYTYAKTVIAAPALTSARIRWKSGTVQGCPPSITLFNIDLYPFLHPMEHEERRTKGFLAEKTEGGTASVSVTVHADDLILDSQTRETVCAKCWG